MQLPIALAERGVLARRRRVFSTSRDRPRFRRATDVLLLVPSALGLAALVAAYPPSRLERSLTAFLRSFPDWLDPLWGLLYDTMALWALALVAAAVVARRHAVWLQAIASVAVAAGVTVVSARLATGSWPDPGDLARLQVDGSTFAVLRVAVCAVVVLVIGAHLVRPLQTAGRMVLLLGLAGAILVEDAPTSATAAAFLTALVAATVVRLVHGTSAGHPESDDVVAALRELGVAVERLEPAARQPAGVFVARGDAVDGRRLLVKVYGRDAYDTQLVEKLWRTALYQGDGPRARLSRIEAVEHEALVTLLAGQAGVPTLPVVVAAESSSGDALLVLVDTARPLAALAPHDLDEAVLLGCWQAVVALGEAGIAHHRIEPQTLALVDGEVGLLEFDRASLAARPDELVKDRAQLLAATAALVGAERAVAAAVAAVGADAVAELLPYLQPAAFDPALRRALRSAEVEVDDLLAATAAAVGVEAPELVRLRRVTWSTLIQLALLVFAVSTVVGALSGLDYEELWSMLGDASWGWIAAGFVVSQLPRVTQAMSTLGSVPARIPFAPVYLMQLATGYMNLALPSNLARMAVNIRFFQRQGIPPATAVTAGAIDSFVSTVAQAILLAALLLFSESSLEFDLERPDGPPVRALVALVALVLTAGAALLLVRRLRTAIAERVRRWWPDVRRTLATLRAGHKLGLLAGGSLATELLFAAALGVFANAFGYDIGLADLLLINISVSLLASFVPVPGGIGVTEFGLTLGLTAAGMPEEAAFAAVLLYRASTFYVPPVWGFVAMRRLQRNAYL